MVNQQVLSLLTHLSWHRELWAEFMQPLARQDMGITKVQYIVTCFVGDLCHPVILGIIHPLVAPPWLPLLTNHITVKPG